MSAQHAEELPLLEDAGWLGWLRRTLPRPLVVAHRAGNELASAESALAAGADVLELDVWLHRGRLEVRHTKTAGPLPLRWDRWSLEPGWRPCPRLPELLDALPEEVPLMLDLKGWARGLPAALVTTLRQQRPGRPVLLCSRNWGLLDACRDYREAVLVHSIGSPRQLAACWPRLRQHDHDAVSIHARLLDAETVRALRRHVSLITSWPVNDARLATRLLELGIDGLTSDDVRAVAPVVAARRGDRW